jgi:hypothetical protein
MGSRGRAGVAIAIFGLPVPLAAEPAEHPELATVFIEVHVDAPDPTTSQRRLTKVGEGAMLPGYACRSM